MFRHATGGDRTWYFRSLLARGREGDQRKEDLMTAMDDPAADAKRRGGKNPASKSPTTSEVAPDLDLLTITIQAKTGQIVKIQSADGGRGSKELSDQERADLLKKVSKDTLEALIEQAFEAGIACAFGDAIGRSEVEESDEEADLRHLLLEPLIRQSPLPRLMQREVLSRAFLGTVVQHSLDPVSPDLGSSSAQQRQGGAPGEAGQGIQPPG